jgi:oxygen-independent coproporphyrinogen-3 oxidase
MYEMGSAMLNGAGVEQYEISNFARAGYESRHNVKYWRRDAYVGFGLDAHSMLHRAADSVRFRNTDDLDEYMAQGGPLPLLPRDTREVESIDREAAFEESLFLGLRMNAGVDLSALSERFGDGLAASIAAAVNETQEAGLLEQCGSRLRLTAHGRMASNEVFSRLLIPAVA